MAKYIDADALIKKGTVTTSACSTSDYVRGYNDFYKALCEAPAADIEPVKHGHWIKVPTKALWVGTEEFERGIETVKDMQECSNCAFEFGNAAFSFLFCTNCEAKMDQEV